MIGYAVNNYVWALLQKHQGWTRINEKLPLIPAQQQPEFMNFKKPFLVYGWTNEYNDGELEPWDSTVIHYVVYAQTIQEVDAAVELLKDAFKAENSQENINAWIRSEDNEDIADEDKNEVINFTQVMDTISGGGTDEEGGWKDALVSVRVGYKTNPVSFAI
jgi:hypothetical protein